MEEQQVKMAIQGLCSPETGDRALDAQRPTYRKPFDMIVKRALFEEWSALLDDFRTFTSPECPF
jgi:hypothetical protein